MGNRLSCQAQLCEQEMPGRNSVPTRAQTRATLTSTVPTAHPMCHVSGLPLYLEFGCVVCAWGGAVTVEGCLPLLLQPAQERQLLLSPTGQTGRASSSFRNPQNAPLHNFHLLSLTLPASQTHTGGQGTAGPICLPQHPYLYGGCGCWVRLYSTGGTVQLRGPVLEFQVTKVFTVTFRTNSHGC